MMDVEVEHSNAGAMVVMSLPGVPREGDTVCTPFDTYATVRQVTWREGAVRVLVRR